MIGTVAAQQQLTEAQWKHGKAVAIVQRSLPKFESGDKFKTPKIKSLLDEARTASACEQPGVLVLMSPTTPALGMQLAGPNQSAPHISELHGFYAPEQGLSFDLQNQVCQ